MLADLGKFVNLLRKSFLARLSEKTNWGRNELIVQFGLALEETIIEYYKEK